MVLYAVARILITPLFIANLEHIDFKVIIRFPDRINIIFLSKPVSNYLSPSQTINSKSGQHCFCIDLLY